MLWWAKAKPGSQFSDWVEIADVCTHRIYSFSEQKIIIINNLQECFLILKELTKVNLDKVALSLVLFS